MILPVVKYGTPVLRQKGTPIEAVTSEIKHLIADMFETMYGAPGIGLAAIQVGVPLRLLVIDLQPDDEDAEPEVCTAHGGHHRCAAQEAWWEQLVHQRRHVMR